MADLKAFAEQLVNLTVKEVNELSLRKNMVLNLLLQLLLLLLVRLQVVQLLLKRKLHSM